MSTKTLNFKIAGDWHTQDVNLLLAFSIPQTTDAFIRRFPVAWKVANLSGPRSQFSVTVPFNALGVAVAHSGANNTVVAGNYAPIYLAQETYLEADNTSCPPIYIFSEPTATTSDNMKVTNVTGQPTDIGFGFISNANQGNESMNLTSVYRGVGGGAVAVSERPYLLRAYTGLNYRESQILGREILSIQPVWEGDLLALQSSTTILLTEQRIATGYSPPQFSSPIQATIVSREIVETPRVKSVDRVTSSTRVVSALPEIVTSIEQPRTIFQNEQRNYSAILAFTNPDIVVLAMQNMNEYFIDRNFQVKFTYTEGTTEATVELTPPYSTSCDQAEKELLASIDSQPDNVNKTRIISRSGSQMVSLGRNFSYWVKINPASADWFGATRQIASPSPRVRYVPFSPRVLTATLPTPTSYSPKNRLLPKRTSSASSNASLNGL